MKMTLVFIRDFQMQDSFTLSRFTAKPMATDITIEWSMLTARRRIADEETIERSIVVKNQSGREIGCGSFIPRLVGGEFCAQPIVCCWYTHCGYRVADAPFGLVQQTAIARYGDHEGTAEAEKFLIVAVTNVESCVRASDRLSPIIQVDINNLPGIVILQRK